MSENPDMRHPDSGAASKRAEVWSLMAWLALLVAVLGGAANPFQGATNAELHQRLAQPVWSGVVVYASGLIGMMLVLAAMRQTFPASRAGAVPWWAWMGGLISLGSTMSGILMTQKLGSGLFTAASVTAAVVTSVLIDHFGVVGLRQHTASPGRLVGCALLIAGVWLVAKF
jgi:transporter family-2 protein